MTTKLILRRFGLMVLLAMVILLITWIALQMGPVVNPATIAFIFLIFIALSAVFTDLPVAIVTSIVATMCFNYFFLQPVGTFFIADFDDWIALFVFLCAAILISRLTASAHENAGKARNLDRTLQQLKEFGHWLLSLPREQITLPGIAEGAVRIFSLQYCSIHVHAEGKWQHFSGSAVGELSRKVTDRFKSMEEYPTKLMDLVDEASLGVRYSQILRGTEPVAVLVVKSDDLPANAMNTIACMVGVLVPEILGIVR